MNRKIDLFSPLCQLGTHRNSIPHTRNWLKMLKNQFMQGPYIGSVYFPNTTSLSRLHDLLGDDQISFDTLLSEICEKVSKGWRSRFRMNV